MCWRTNGLPKFKVAQEDITSYKIVNLNANNGTYDAIYYPFHYIPGVLEEGKLEIERKSSVWGTEINVAFHSYSEKPIFQFIQFGVLIKHPKMDINLGCFPLESVLDGNYVVVRCIMPEGTKYYVNDFGEIASDRIILTKEYWNVLA